jgi:hypothetical protein
MRTNTGAPSPPRRGGDVEYVRVSPPSPYREPTMRSLCQPARRASFSWRIGGSARACRPRAPPQPDRITAVAGFSVTSHTRPGNRKVERNEIVLAADTRNWDGKKHAPRGGERILGRGEDHVVLQPEKKAGSSRFRIRSARRRAFQWRFGSPRAGCARTCSPPRFGIPVASAAHDNDPGERRSALGLIRRPPGRRADNQ